MKRFMLTAVVVLVALGCGTSEKQATFGPDQFDPNYTAYARVLAGFVTGEAVDYQTLKEQRADLDLAVNQLAALPADKYAAMSRNEQIALWINAYNALTLRSVIDRYPFESIQDLKSARDSTEWTVAGRQVTINDIAHEILRPEFKDPRLHFAVNCASVSCPPLASQPFLPATLDRQLDQAARSFVNEVTRNKINPHTLTLTTSGIFSAYGEDFVEKYGTDQFDSVSATEAAILNFVFSHVDSSVLDMINTDAIWTVEYFPYDRSLNDVGRKRPTAGSTH